MGLGSRAEAATRGVRADGLGRPARRPGLAHLHLGNHRYPQGRHAEPWQLRQQHPRPGRARALQPGRRHPLLPAPVPRPGTDRLLPLPVQGLHHRLRRERGGRGREHAGDPADHDGQRAAPVREDLRPGHGPGPGRLGRQEAHLLLGRQDRQGRRRADHRRQAAAPRPGLPAEPGPQARLPQDPGQDRRPLPLPGLRRGAAGGRHRRVLLRRRSGHHGRLRADRDGARPGRQQPLEIQDRHGRHGPARRDPAHRRGRRNPGPGAERHARLLQERGRDARSRWPAAGSTPATWAAWTTRAT